MNVREIADNLELISKLMILTGENRFKARAFENAARSIIRIENFDELMEKDELSNIKGIGVSLNETIKELYFDNYSSVLEELKKKIPQGVMDMLSLKGLGVKKIKELITKLGIVSIGELEYACNENRLTILKGFGKKTQDNILKSIKIFKKREKVLHYPEAKKLADEILRTFKKDKNIKKIAVTGNLRRKLEITDSIEFVVEPGDRQIFLNSLKEIYKTINVTMDTVICRIKNIGICFHISEDNFNKDLFHTTGSNEFLSLPEIKRGMSGDFTTEKNFFNMMNINFIPPECRETILRESMNDLICYNDVKGMFHIHTKYSDGSSSIEEIVKFLMCRGFQYAGISDHSKSAYYANGLSIDGIKRQHEEIDKLNEQYKPFKIFKGIESDILKNGDLDYPDKILETFDFVIASVHSSFTLSEKEMTARMIKAVENPFTTIVGHPTGRLLLYREPYKLNMEKFLEAVAENKKFVEINCHPYRLDLSWENCIKGKQLGIKFFINTDAHNMEGFSYLKYGINVARKACLSRDDIINCKSVEKFAREVL